MVMTQAFIDLLSRVTSRKPDMASPNRRIRKALRNDNYERASRLFSRHLTRLARRPRQCVRCKAGTHCHTETTTVLAGKVHRGVLCETCRELRATAPTVFFGLGWQP
jgi:hypothetical protein